VPALNFDGWYDVFLNGAIENFVGMRRSGGSAVARQGQQLVIGPWIHLPWVPRDVLVYSTPRLSRRVEVTGPITVTLYASSSARDTDFTAKLVDVYPDGRAINLNDGIQRARYRVSDTHPTLIRPGKIYRYTIHVWPTSNLFKPGHQIRLEISSSNFPMYDRNPNTGDPFGQNARLQATRQTIYHDPAHPSSITLPLMPVPIH
jgi:uncharacterized protein